ncbi:MAG: hypothetical protein HC840_27515 [Leptolyngbyaceae cyanobacterium RM2_2_4]|nr:hypothetical protein [Leptolyngbyaceae cyanobacterium RM2_2_4]
MSSLATQHGTGFLRNIHAGTEPDAKVATAVVEMLEKKEWMYQSTFLDTSFVKN